MCREGRILDKITEPPKYFTDATLLQAMTGIARFVSDTNLKKILRETDGLGTEATRAGILALLFKRNLLVKSGKTLRATDAGLALIQSLPIDATVPDMTAHWEHQLKAITTEPQRYQTFMLALTQQVFSLLSSTNAERLVNLKKLAVSNALAIPLKRNHKRKI
jgi:DNA topoisomerase-3